MKYLSKEKVFALRSQPHSPGKQGRIAAELDAVLPTILDRAFKEEL